MLVGQRRVHARLQSCVDCAPAVCRHQPLLLSVFEFRFDPCLLEASRLRRGTHLAVSLSTLSWVEVSSLDLPVAQVEGPTFADFNGVGVWSEIDNINFTTNPKWYRRGDLKV